MANEHRYEYARLTPETFERMLTALDMSNETLARLAALQPSRIAEMVSGKRPIPHLVALLVRIMMEDAGAIVIIRQFAAEMITRDNRTGQINPFMEGRNDSDD